ncbi:MAG: SLBB domain-containing protein [Planctomycetaceae bacterium]
MKRISEGHQHRHVGGRQRSLRWGCALLCCIVFSTGCASKKYYAPEEMPAELVAHPQVNPQTLDLTKLASSTANSEIIAAGDTLAIMIAAGLNSDDTFEVKVRVNDEGFIRLPEIPDPIPLEGLDLEEAEQVVTAWCVQYGLYVAPTVGIVMEKRRLNHINVTGAVNIQGPVELPRNRSDLLSVLVAAGGLAEDAGTKIEIRSSMTADAPDQKDDDPIAGVTDAPGMQAGHSFPVKRNTTKNADGHRSTKIDLVSATKQGNTADYNIPDGSTVMVERRAHAPIQVMGRVAKPLVQEYPTTHDLRLLDAIALAGGLSSPVADRVIVIRPVPGKPDPAVIKVSLQDAKHQGSSNVLLAPGDVVYVEQTAATVLLDAVQIVRFAVGASLGTLL